MKLIFEGEAEQTLMKAEKPNTMGATGDRKWKQGPETSRSLCREVSKVKSYDPRGLLPPLRHVASIQVLAYTSYLLP